MVPLTIRSSRTAARITSRLRGKYGLRSPYYWTPGEGSDVRTTAVDGYTIGDHPLDCFRGRSFLSCPALNGSGRLRSSPLITLDIAGAIKPDEQIARARTSLNRSRARGTSRTKRTTNKQIVCILIVLSSYLFYLRQYNQVFDVMKNVTWLCLSLGGRIKHIRARSCAYIYPK